MYLLEVGTEELQLHAGISTSPVLTVHLLRVARQQCGNVRCGCQSNPPQQSLAFRRIVQCAQASPNSLHLKFEDQKHRHRFFNWILPAYNCSKTIMIDTTSSLLHANFVAGSHRSSNTSSSISTTVRFSTVTHRVVGSVARNQRHRKFGGSLRRMGDELYLRRLPLSILAAVLITKFLPKSIRRTLMRWWKS
ncbi:hypothetical protein RRG08_014959 [Elysia crispata]|uniref:Uncharacterized protein n=1 Tax=Elysia crispata TaxID=231223 RepID=A0AAE1AAV6_9GAST|nr:hypothetical protein RRG08_014959 [Elysia crispata]